MYYSVTLSYKDTMKTDTFKIDENEILSFIEFICTKIPNLENFFTIRHTYDPNELREANDEVNEMNNIYAH